MRSENEQKSLSEGDLYREMRLLSEMERTPKTSQRSLADRLGIGLAMTNLLLRGLARRGYVRVRQAGWRSWVYTVTPAGVSRKVRLTADYVGTFLAHSRSIRQTLQQELEPLHLGAHSPVAIYGRDEFAELVYLGLKEMGIEQVDIFAPGTSPGDKFLGMPVRDATALQPTHYDRVVLASLEDAEASSQQLQEAGVPPEKLVTFFGANGRTAGIPQGGA